MPNPRSIGFWALLLAGAPLVACGSALAGEVTASGGGLSLGTAVNGVVGGSCGSGFCQVTGGTAAGSNLFHRLSAFDTRGAITGVNVNTGGLPNVFMAVTNPAGTFIDKLVNFSGPTNLVWLSPGGISLSGAGGFANIQQLNLSTATGWRVGNGVFDAAGTTAGQAALLSGMPLQGLAGAVNDPAALEALGLQKNGDLSLAGGLLTVDQSLLLDAQGGNVLLQAAGIQAPGGRVEIQGQSVLQNAPIDVSGASGGGTINLQAGADLTSAAPITATGTGPAAKGGTVELTAPSVTLAAAQVDASGSAGGGAVRVGGGVQGSPLSLGGANATTTTVDSSSTLKADATQAGNGGQVVVWAERATRVDGAISTRGGSQGGDGGFVETSGKQQLAVSRAPDASAPQGKGGTWLLDPNNLTVNATGPDSNVSGFPNATTTGDSAVIAASTIKAALDAGTSVSLATSAGGAQAGDITVAAPISKTAGGNASLSLNAHNNININADITSTVGALNLNLVANSDNANGGSVQMTSGRTINLNGGNLNLAGNGDYTLSSGSVFQNLRFDKSGTGFYQAPSSITLNGVTVGTDMTFGGSLTILNDLLLADGVTVNKGANSWFFGTTGLRTLGLAPGASSASVNSSGGAITSDFGVSGQTLSIGPGITLQSSGTGTTSLTNSNTASIINNGTIASTTGGAWSITPTSFTNNGAVTASNGTVTIGSNSSSFTNNGVVTANNGTVSINATNWNNTSPGVFNVGSGGTLNLGGSFTTANLGVLNRSAGALNITGTFNLGGSTLDVGSAGLFGPGGLTGLSGTLAGGTLISTDATPALASLGSGTLSGMTIGSNLSINGSTLILNDLLLADGVTVNKGASNWFFSTTGGRTLGLAPGAESATVTSSGGSIFAGFGVSGQTLSIGPGITLQSSGTGTTTLTNSSAASIINNGTIATTTGGAWSITPTSFTNNSAVTASNGTVTIGSTSSSFTNNGVVTANNGTVSINATNWNNTSPGVFNVGSGGTLNLGGSFTTANLGVLNRSAGALNITGTFNLGGSTLDVGSAGLFGPGGLSQLSGTLAGGTLISTDATPALASSGSGTLSGITIGSNLSINGSLNFLNDLLLADGVTVNKGANSWFFGTTGLRTLGLAPGASSATVTSSGGSILAGFGVSGQTLSIGPGITLQSSGTGTTTLTNSSAASIINNGTIAASSGGAWSITPTSFTNNGAVTASNGTVTIGSTSFTNNGEVTANNGTVSINATNWDNTSPGVFNVGSGGTLNLGGSFTTANLGVLNRSAGALVITGTFNLGGSTLDVGSAGLFGPGGLTGLSGTLAGGTLISTDATPSLESSAGTLSGMTIGTNLSVYGSLTILNDLLLADGVTVNKDSYDWLFGSSGLRTLGLAPGATSATVISSGGGIYAGYVVSGQTLSIGPGITLQSSGTGTTTLTNSSAASIINNGTIASTTGGAWSITPTSFTNNSAVTASNGTVTIGSTSSSFTNNGEVTANNGTVSINATSWNNTSPGVFNVGSGGTLNLGGSFTTANLGGLNRSAGALNITGTFNLGGSTLDVGSAGLFGPGGLSQLSGGTLAGGTLISTDATPALATSGTATLSGITIGSNLSVGSTFILNDLLLADGVTVNKEDNFWLFASSGLRILGLAPGASSASVISSGGEISAGSLVSGQTLSIGSGITLQSSGTGTTSLTDSNTAPIINNGTIASTTGGTWNITPTSFTNGATGKLVVATGSTLATGNNSFTNNGTIEGSGTINVGTGTITNNGTINPGGTGAAGTLAITGNLTNSASGIIEAELGGTTAGSQYDVLAVSGNVTLGGTLNSPLNKGFVPSGQSFDVITAGGSAIGSFTTLSLPSGVNGAVVGNVYRLTASGVSCTGICWDGGGGNTDWNTDANWTGDVLPGVNDIAFLNLVAGVTVDHGSGTNSIKGMNSDANNDLTISGGSLTLNDPATTSTLNGALSLTGGTLTANGTLNVSNTYSQSGGALTGSGTLTLTGANNSWSGGTISGGGSLDVAADATLTLNGVTKFLGDRTINNAGTITWTDGNISQLNNNTINNSGLFGIQGDLAFGNNVNYSLTNSGSAFVTAFVNTSTGELRRSSGNGVTYLGDSSPGYPQYGYVNLSNAGLLDVRSGTLTLQGSGVATESSGTFRTTSSGISTPSLQLLSGTYNLTPAAQIQAFSGSEIGEPAGVLQISGGSLTLTTGLDSAAIGGQLVINGGAFAVEGAAQSSGNIQLSSGSFGGSGTLTLTGASNTWSGGTISGGGSLDVAADATLTLNGGTKNLADRTINNAGTIVWSEGYIAQVGNSTINNSGLFDIQGDFALGNNSAYTFAPGTSYVTAFVNNASGELRRSSGNGGAYLGDSDPAYSQYGYVDLSNNGLVDVQSGTLRLEASGVATESSGTFRTTSSGGSTPSLQLLSGTYNLTPAAQIQAVSSDGSDPAGILQISGGSLTLTTGLDSAAIGGQLVINGGAFALEGAAQSSGNIQLSSGSFGGSGTLTLTGASNTWSGGAISGGGSLDVGAGATLTLNGGTKNLADRTINNAGTIIWSAGYIAQVGNSTINNSGLFDIQGDFALGNNSAYTFAPGTSYVTAFVNNASGELRRSSGNGGGLGDSDPGLSQYGYVDLSNNGLVDVRSGTLTLQGSGVATESSGTFRTTSSGGSTIPSLQLLSGTYSLTPAAQIKAVSSDGSDPAGILQISGGSLTLTTGLDRAVIGGQLVINGGAFALEGAAQSSGNIQLSSGSFGGSGTLTLTGANNSWSGGTISGGGSLDVGAGATLTLNGGTKNLADRTINNAGTIIWSAGYIAQVGNSTINNSGLFDIQGDFALGNNSAYTFAPGTSYVTAFVNNASGELRRSSGNGGAYLGDSDPAYSQYGYVDLSNNGLVDVQSGTLRLEVSGVATESSGTFRTTSTDGSTPLLQLASGTYTLNTGASITAISSDGTTASGLTRLDGATLDVKGAPTVSGFEIASGVVSGTGNLVINGEATWSGGTLSGSGSVDVGAGATLTLNGGTKNLADRTINNAGTIIWSAGYIAQVGNSTINNSGLFDIRGDFALGNNSAYTFAPGTSYVTAFVNSASGELRRSSGNGGAYLGDSDPAYSQYGYVDLSNNGLVDVQSGVLRLEGSFSQAGALSLANNSTFARSGGFTNAGTISGTGSVDVGAGSVLTNLGTISPGGSGAAGTLNIIGNVNLTDGTLAIDVGGTAAGQSDLLAVSGNVTLGGTITGGSLTVSGLTNLDGVFTVAGGSATLSGGLKGSNGALALQSGSLNLDGPSTLGGFSQSGGSLLGGGSLEVLGAYARTGGTIGSDFSSVSITQASGDLAPGVLSVAGPLSLTTLDPGSTLLINAQVQTTAATSPITVQAAGSLVVGSEASVAGTGAVNLQSSGDISLAAGSAISSAATGDALVLASGGNFNNLAGSAALNTPSGRWLVYSNNPELDNRGGLAYDFKSYGQSYTGSAYTGPGLGNGFLYTTAPTITPGLTGSLTKTYDGNTPATLAAANYITSGAIDGDLVVLNNPAVGTYNSKNVLEANSVSVGGLSIASATDSAGNEVYGYTLTTDVLSAEGSITPLTLSGAAIADGSSIYGSALAPGAVSFGNIVGTDAVLSSATVNTGALSTSGNYVAGSYSQSAGTTLSGADAGNYSFSGFSSTANYTITPLTLSGAAIASGSSIYGSALAPGAVSFSNIIGADAVLSSAAVNTSILSSSGNAVVGSYSQSASGLGGADAGNYSFSGFTTETGNYTITPLTLSGAAIASGSSIYGSALAPGAVSFGNIIGADAVLSSATVNTGALSTSGNYVAGSYSQSAGTELIGADAGNYSFSGFSSATPNYTITPLTLSGAAIADGSSIYGASLTPGLVSFGNIIGADAVLSSATVNTGALSTSGNYVAGSYSQSAGTTLSGADAGNYDFSGFTTETPNYTITPLTLSGAAIADGSSIYGSALAPGAVSFGNIIGADAVLLSATVNTGALSTSGNYVAGSYSQSVGTELIGADAGNYAFSGFTTETPNYTITLATISSVSGITAASRTYDGTTTASLNIAGAGFTGSISGDSLVVVGASGAFLDKNAGTAKSVFITGISLGGTDALNYTLASSSANTTADISKANLLVGGASVSSKVYDATTAATVTGGSVTALGSDLLTLSGSNAVFADKNVGTGKSVTTAYSLSGLDAGNYTLLQPSSLTADISKANLLVGGASVSSKVYDATTAASVTGGGITALGSDLLTLSGANAVFADKNVGTGKSVTTAYSLSGLDAGNYTLLQPSSLTADISKANLLVGGASVSSKVYDATTAATVTGGSVTALGSDLLTLSGSNAVFADKNVGTGKSVTTAYSLSGLDAGNYTLLQPSSLTADISKANLLVGGASVSSKVYDATTAASVTGGGITALGSDLLTLSGANAVFADKNVGTGKSVTTAYSLSGLDAGNYTLLQPSSLTADISKANLLVGGASVSSKVYDATTAASVTGGGITALGSDLLTLSGANAVFADKNVGTGKSVTTAYSLSGLDAGNYTLLQPSSLTADISKANLLVGGASVSSKVYDATTAASVTGGGITALGSDLLTLSGANAVFADKNVGTGKSVTTAYSLSGLDAGNYTLLQPSSLTADISKANLLVGGASVSSKVYDATTAATVTGGSVTALGSDLLTLSGSNAVFADKNVGTGKSVTTAYSLSGLDAGNYTLLQPSSLTADISKANLLVGGASVSSKVYDATTAASVTGGGITALGSDLLTLSGANAVFADKNVGTGKSVTTAYSLSGLDAGNYTLLQPSSLTADISVRPQSTWRGTVAGLWSDPTNWDALPSGTNVASVLIPAGSAAVSYDAAAGSTQLQSLITNQNLSVDGGSLAVSGASSVGAGGVLSLNAGGFSTASLLNQGLLNGSGALLLDGLYSESGSGRFGTGFSSVNITQRSGDLSLKGVGATGPIILTSSTGALNLSGAVQSAGSAISVGASGPLTLANGASLTSAGATITLASAAPLSLQGSRIDASGGAGGGTVQLDGSSISIIDSSVNTSGAADGGTIRIGGRSLPSSVTISGSSLVADPPGLGGTISVDGALIAITGSSFNVFGLSGGTISLGSSSTASLSLDAFSSLIGGGGATFGLVASSISNSASFSGGVLTLNGQVPVVITQPLATVPSLVTFQQSVNSLQPLQLATAIDYTAPLSLLVTQWEVLGLDLLALNLSESSFLYSDAYDSYKIQQDALRLDQVKPAGLVQDDKLRSGQQAIPKPDQIKDEQKKRLEESLAKTGGNPSLITPLDNQADQMIQDRSIPGESQQQAGVPMNQPAGIVQDDKLRDGQQAIPKPDQIKDEQKKRLEESLAKTGGNPALITPLDNQADQMIQDRSIPGGSQQQAGGLVNQPVQQLSEQQASAQFTAAEQKAAQTTAEKLGLPAVSSGSVPTPAEMQQYLRQVIEALQRGSGK